MVEKKVNTGCHTCRKPIYKNDLFYEITPSGSAENIFGISHSEKIIQCDLCHDLSLIEQKKKRKGKNQAKGILGIFAVLFLSIVLFGLYPTLEENGTKLSGKKFCGNPWKPGAVCGIILTLSSIIVLTLYGIISIEFVIRYKNRGEEEGEKRGKKKPKN